MILYVKGRDGVSTSQNGVAAYSQSHVSRILARVVSRCLNAVFVFLGVLLLWYILPNCEGFPLTSLSL